MAEVLVLQEVLEQASKSHGAGHFLLARALCCWFIDRAIGKRDLRVAGASLGQVAAECPAALVQILNRFVLIAGVVIRRLVHIRLESGIGDGDAHVIAEGFEVLERQLLHLVSGVAALEAWTEAVALDRLCQNDGGLALVVHCGFESRVDLAVVVATTLEVPDLIVGHVRDHRQSFGVAAEEVLANIGAIFGFVGLVVAIGRAVHQVSQRTVGVSLQERVPFATPHDLDDVPSRTTEETLQFLDDFSVATNRAIESLEVAVDDKGQVIEVVVGGELECATAFHFVHLAIAQEGPDMLLAGVLDSAVVHIAVELSLIDGIDRPKAHRHRGELPELRHEARVWVGRESTGVVGLLLTEAIELFTTEATFKEGPRIHARRGVALVEDLVSATGVILAPEEVVVAHFIECRRGRVGRDVATHTDARSLGAVHRNGGVPANPGAVATLNLFVAGELGFIFGSDGVEVIGGGDHRHAQVQLLRALEQAQHDFSATLVAGLRYD